MYFNPQLDYIAPVNCKACPRLASFLDKSRKNNPHWHNGPVPSFGSVDAEILILGLAPGLKGANRTGRPFTGDFAGITLYNTLMSHGFASGNYDANCSDNLVLKNIRISNAVRCVPPQNKPIGSEINNCRPFLSSELERMQKLKVILSLGRIAHDTLIRHFKLSAKNFLFKHCKSHLIKTDLILLNSYHCSRYNINTGRLTQKMFDDVIIKLSQLIND